MSFRDNFTTPGALCRGPICNGRGTRAVRSLRACRGSVFVPIFNAIARNGTLYNVIRMNSRVDSVLSINTTRNYNCASMDYHIGLHSLCGSCLCRNAGGRHRIHHISAGGISCSRCVIHCAVLSNSSTDCINVTGLCHSCLVGRGGLARRGGRTTFGLSLLNYTRASTGFVNFACGGGLTLAAFRRNRIVLRTLGRDNVSGVTAHLLN